LKFWEWGKRTDTTPTTPYPPSSAAFSILTALLSFMDFAIVWYMLVKNYRGIVVEMGLIYIFIAPVEIGGK
jgi:hypothetical protein